MTNVAYDVPLTHWAAFTLGLGTGAAWVDPSVTPDIASGGKIAWAWQGLAGFTVMITRGLALQMDYRYVSIGGTTHKDAFAGGNMRFDTETTRDRVMVSLRWYPEARW